MLSYRCSNRGLVLLLLFACLSIFSCQKDFQTDQDSRQTRDITIHEVKDAYSGLTGTGLNERSSMRLPMNAVPVWEYPYTYSAQGFPIIIIAVHPHSIFQDTHHGSKLAFYKDNQGLIQCDLLIWQTDSLSSYTSPNAPLDTSSHFNGLMVSISAQDSITRVVQIEDGKVTIAKEGSVPIKVISNTGLQGNLLQERDCNDDPGCAKWGRSWWDRLLEVFDGIGSFFGNIINLDPGTSGGSIFFGSAGGGSGGLGLNEVIIAGGGSGGGGSSNGNNTNTNGAAHIDNLYYSGLIPEDLWIELTTIHVFFPQSVESMKWLILNEEVREELLAFSREYGSAGAAVVQAATQQDSEETRLHGLAVMRFAMSGVMRFSSAQLQFFLGNKPAFLGLSTFATEYTGQEDVALALRIVIDYAIKKGITDVASGDFSAIGADDFPCGACFATALAMEYAIAKRDCPSCSDWYLLPLATWNVISTGVHLLLDTAGLAPGIGEVADLVSGGIYILEGNYVDAGLSAGSAVPFAGWTTYGTKYGRKIVNALGKSTELRYVVRGSDQIIQFGWDLAGGRKQLRRILGTPSGWEAHHIIPWQFREHPVIQAAAHVGSNNAFHMNELLNGISLPKTGGSGLPQHLGSHPDYNTRVLESLDAIQGQLGPNMSPQDALNRLTTLIQDINIKIKNTNGGTINNVSGW